MNTTFFKKLKTPSLNVLFIFLAWVSSFVLCVIAKAIFGDASDNLMNYNPFVNGFIHGDISHLGMNLGLMFIFLIPDINKIYFYQDIPRSVYNSYNPKYDVAFFNNTKIINKTKNKYCFYLSRITKKNGKYRYYISREEIDCIQIEHCDREIDIFHYDYISEYIGTNLFTAIMHVIYYI